MLLEYFSFYCKNILSSLIIKEYLQEHRKQKYIVYFKNEKRIRLHIWLTKQKEKYQVMFIFSKRSMISICSLTFKRY